MKYERVHSLGIWQKQSSCDDIITGTKTPSKIDFEVILFGLLLFSIKNFEPHKHIAGKTEGFVA